MPFHILPPSPAAIENCCSYSEGSLQTKICAMGSWMGEKSLSEQASIAAWNQDLKVPWPGYRASTTRQMVSGKGGPERRGVHWKERNRKW